MSEQSPVTPDLIRAARAALELAHLDQVAASQRRSVRESELEVMAQRLGAESVHAAMQASKQLRFEVEATVEAQQLMMRAREGARPKAAPVESPALAREVKAAAAPSPPYVPPLSTSGKRMTNHVLAQYLVRLDRLGSEIDNWTAANPIAARNFELLDVHTLLLATKCLARYVLMDVSHDLIDEAQVQQLAQADFEGAWVQ